MKAFLLCLLLLSGAASAQSIPYSFSPIPLDTRTRLAAYAAEVAVAQASQEQLFGRARHWLEAAPAYKAAAQRTSPEAGTIQFRGTLCQGQETVGFRLAVAVEDGRYRYRLDQITRTQPNFGREGKHSPANPTVTTNIETLIYTRPRKSRDRKLTEIDSQLRKLLHDLDATMQDKPAGVATN